ncbi:hypothetical protein AAHA92_13581 [Salvia divinorum]|uniref:Uncharacterized protein n=1 Tax=Salvia divinorum TaxID=28513 RepID=A0ABD1HA03_SALDI
MEHAPAIISLVFRRSQVIQWIFSFETQTGRGSSNFDQDIFRCPFLRNINEPTNFPFTSSMAFPIPAQNGKGPIFEDGPNFDMAFRLFHGQNGVVPLCSRQQVTKTLKRGSSSKGGEAMSDDWLQKGNCPIAKSYRAVSSVLPLVAKALQPPPGMKYRCPPAIVAARSAVAKTAFAENLRPQHSPCLQKHAQEICADAMAFTIAASILGQVIGSRAERYRLKTAADARESKFAETLIIGATATMRHPHCACSKTFQTLWAECMATQWAGFKNFAFLLNFQVL